jgi:hypothetical protein
MVGFQRGYSGELRSVSEFFGPHKVINFVTLAELLPEP